MLKACQLQQKRGQQNLDKETAQGIRKKAMERLGQTSKRKGEENEEVGEIKRRED